ncbi:MAG: DUF2147 domain-containing protein [Acidobacteria bacterium]|nr:DUF2147 domain-containing protein [Acidobacteriota bacterium]
MRQGILLVLAVFLMLGSATAVQAQKADDILGVWKTAETDKGYSHVKIYKDGGKYFGEIIWLLKPNYPADEPGGLAGKPKVDRNNPDKSKRDQPILGLKLLKGFNFDGGEWNGGTIYDPENGKTYKCIMKLDGETLNVRGYIGFSLLGRTTQWTRVEDKDSGEMMKDDMMKDDGMKDDGMKDDGMKDGMAEGDSGHGLP